MNKKIFKKYIRTLPKKANLLDIGCSDCCMIKVIRKFRPDIQFHGINITTRGYTVPEYVNFKICNVEKMSYDNEFFDVILCFHVLEHVKDTSKARDEIFRVLKKGGLFFGETPHWISMITPFGYNFFDDPTHIRPYTVKGFLTLTNVDNKYDVLYGKFDNPNFLYYSEVYGIPHNLGYFFRLVLKALGLYRSVVAVVLKKKQ